MTKTHETASCGCIYDFNMKKGVRGKIIATCMLHRGESY